MASCDGNEFETNRHSLTVFSSCNRASAAHTETPTTKFQTPGKLQYSNLQTQAPAFSSLPCLKIPWDLEFGIWCLLSAGTAPARSLAVETAKHSPRKVAADPDIFFHCQHCKAALVANRSAAGMMLTCRKCSKLTTVPKSEEPSANAPGYAEEIRGKLTENESQRAEITGNINQLTIQLHRWQLRLQTLNERKTQLEKELGQR